MDTSEIVLGIILILSASYTSSRLLENKKYTVLYLIVSVPLSIIAIYKGIELSKGEDIISTLIDLPDKFHMILFSVVWILISIIGNAVLPDNKSINIIEIEDHLVE